VRTSVVLLLLSLAGIIGGAALIGTQAIGAAVIFDSLCTGAWALARDDGTDPQPQVHPVPGSTLAQIFDRSRAS